MLCTTSNPADNGWAYERIVSAVRGCADSARPTAANLAGSWLGSLRSTGAGPIGLGDWSRLRLTLQPSGGDELVTNDGQRFSINDTVLGDQRILGLVLAPHDSCVSDSLVITSVQVDNAGATQAFSGSMSGRWCNTLVGTFTFTKG